MTAPTHSNDLNNAVTQDAMASFSKATDPRLAHVMSLLVKHLHAFVDESHLSKAEWLKGLEFLTAAAKITDDERNEFSLFSDIMGISSIVDVVSQPPNGTPSSVLGPFHKHDSHIQPNGTDLTQGQPGVRVWLHGHVLDIHQKPIPNAQIDFGKTQTTVCTPLKMLRKTRKICVAKSNAMNTVPSVY